MKRVDFSKVEKKAFFFFRLRREDLKEKKNWREREGEKKRKDQLIKFEEEKEMHVLFLEEPPFA